MAAVIPPPPAGFTLDNTPPPPSGFTLDARGGGQTNQSAPGRLERLAVGATDIVRGINQLGSNIFPDAVNKYFTMGENGGVQFNPYMDTPEGREKYGATAERANAIVQNFEDDYQARRGSDDIDWLRLGGNVASMVPLALTAPFSGGGLFGTAAMSAGGGALTSALMPATDKSRPFWDQKREQAGIGAVTGGVVGPGLQVLAKGIAPKLSAGISDLMNRGVVPTPGQILGRTGAKIEETLTSIPGIGDFIKNSQRRAIESFNRASYDEVLAPIGVKYSGKEVGHAGVKEVGDTLSNAYDELVPNLQLVPDKEFFQALDDAAASTNLMSDTAARQFQTIVEQELPKGPLAGEALKKLESKLTTEISRFGKSTDPSDQMVSEALEQVRSAVVDNLARVNPAYAERLSAINSGWANLVRLERAAANTKEGVFTPEGLLSAVKAADDSVRKRAVARGTAGPMQGLGKTGNEVLGRTYPDSGTPGRILTSAAALGYIEPNLLLAAAAGSAPYSVLGQKIATAILTKRPELAQPARKLLEKSAVPAGTIAPAFGGLVAQPPKKQRHRNEGR